METQNGTKVSMKVLCNFVLSGKWNGRTLGTALQQHWLNTIRLALSN